MCNVCLCRYDSTCVASICLIRNETERKLHSLRLDVFMHAYFNEPELPTSVISSVLKMYSIFLFIYFFDVVDRRGFCREDGEKKVMTVSYDNSICADKRAEWVPNVNNLMWIQINWLLLLPAGKSLRMPFFFCQLTDRLSSTLNGRVTICVRPNK